MNHAVEQALAAKSPARQTGCGCQPKGQAADDCPERDAQAQPPRLNFGRTDIELQAHPTVTGTRWIARKGPSGCDTTMAPSARAVIECERLVAERGGSNEGQDRILRALKL